MRSLQILMPMAGLGSRFANAGFTIPKPLISVDGLPMFQKALSSVKGINAAQSFHFVIRQEHINTQNLDKLIQKVLPTARITVIPSMTRGAAETAFAAKDTLDMDAGLIIMDCDLWFNSPSYNTLVSKSLAEEENIDGALLTFGSDNPRYSYVRIDKNGYVAETAEKRVISNRAITGAYYFTSARIFTDCASRLLASPLDKKMPEYYISLLYNILINDGGKVKAAYVEEFASFGTPEELDAYNQAQHL